MRNLVTAIKNRDGGVLAQIAGDTPPPADRGVHADVERLVDTLFSNLKQLFPASVSTALRDPRDEAAAKRQWIAAFAENGITSKQHLSAGMKYARASTSPFWPSPGQFVDWCRQGEASKYGLPDADQLYDMVMDYSARRGFYSSPEKFPWPSNECWLMVPALYSQMRSGNLTAAELRNKCVKELRSMVRRLDSGEQIRAPVAVAQLPVLHCPVTNDKGLEKIAEIRRKLGLSKQVKS